MKIAHAVAKHSVRENESSYDIINLGTQVADIFLGGAIKQELEIRLDMNTLD